MFTICWAAYQPVYCLSLAASQKNPPVCEYTLLRLQCTLSHANQARPPPLVSFLVFSIALEGQQRKADCDTICYEHTLWW